MGYKTWIGIIALAIIFTAIVLWSINGYMEALRNIPKP
jgi:hypothetical protein